MRSSGSFAAAVAAVAASVVGTVVVLPLLAFGAGETSPTGCGAAPTSPAAGAELSLVGETSVTEADIVRWWRSGGRGQPPRLGLDVDDVVAVYLAEAEAESIRGDVAFVQATYETGWFTSTDTARNNFAGIAHYDGQPSGRAFLDVPTGVRAHVQLLKKFAAGNETQLARPDVAPDAGARATTWDQLAGTWASAPDYWDELGSLYRSLLESAGQEAPSTARPSACPPAADDAAGPGSYEGAPGNVPLVTVEGITVHTQIGDQVAGLVQAARADGYTLTGSGYREPNEQVELRRRHCGTSQYAIYEMPSSQCSPPTARPGTSNHETGLAVDFSCDGAVIRSRSSACFRWMTANAGSFGLHNLPSEPWHWSINDA